MGSQTRAKQRDRISQDYLNSLIKKPEPERIERPPVEAKPVFHSNEEYDTLHPEEKIREFCGFIRQALAQYEFDKEQLSNYECQMQDVLHFMEMTSDKDAVNGYRLYKELSEIRRKRRICKNEIDLLQPIYDLFHATKVLDQLASVQGSCRTAKAIIDGKGYTVRTDVLKKFA